MEAHSVQAGFGAGTSDRIAPQPKEGGVAAGITAIIRELGELLANSGALVVVVICVIAVMTITSASLGTVPEAERATVSTAAFTLLGTIVGAYFGVRVGSRGKEEAEAARAMAASKVERLAAHVDASEAEHVLDAVEKAHERAPHA